MPDPMPLYVTMGAMAGNMLTGTPVWLMLIGSSGCGKTMLLKSLLKLPKVEPVSSIKGEAALLSGTKKKEMAADATGGLLRVIGDNGCLAFMDFTSVLSKSREAVNELLGVLRELFDRTWSRDIGGEGGRKLSHNGRVCLIAGVTPAVDRAADVNKEMGERCLYFRYPYTTGYQEGMTAVQETEPDAEEQARQEAVVQMFEALSLSFIVPTRRRKLEVWEANRIVTLAQLGARCRSLVPRDNYTHMVNDVTSPEVSTRMAKELAQLYAGMEAVGNTSAERWAALKKVTMDSMSLARRLVLDKVIEGQGHAKGVELAKEVRLSERAADRVLEDLELLGVVRRNGKGWDVSEWTEEKFKEVEKAEGI